MLGFRIRLIFNLWFIDLFIWLWLLVLLLFCCGVLVCRACTLFNLLGCVGITCVYCTFARGRYCVFRRFLACYGLGGR